MEDRSMSTTMVKQKMLSLSLLMLAVVKISANSCYQKYYYTIRKAGTILPPEDTLSNHHVDKRAVEIKCFLLCKKEPKCVGFNYRITTMDVENCQLAKITSKTNTSKTGDWTFLSETDVKVVPDRNTAISTNPEKKAFDSCQQALENYGYAENGAYRIKTDSLTEYSTVFCHMTSIQGCSGGGWTMVMKIKGSKVCRIRVIL